MATKDILQIAVSQLGVHEIKGEEDNPTIVNYAKDIGMDWVTDDETPWCAIFVNWCAKQAGLNGSNSAAARSLLTVGTEVTDPVPGDIVVFWRGSIDGTKGHVGFFMGYNKAGNRIFCLGGNQGDSVSISKYRTDRILGYRRLTKTEMRVLPDGILRKGARGEGVKDLQNILNSLGFKSGTADGIFGNGTKNALVRAQQKGGLGADGIYGPGTRNFLESLLDE